MNLAKINKALHGGLAAAITALGGTGGVSVSLPANEPHAGVVQYVCTAIVGFIVGFCWVYFAPANAQS
jgi:hypothetical protein